MRSSYFVLQDSSPHNPITSMASEVQLTNSDIARIVRASGFTSSLHRDLVEMALLIVLRETSRPSLRYIHEVLGDLSHNLVSDSVLDRVEANITMMAEEQEAA